MRIIFILSMTLLSWTAFAEEYCRPLPVIEKEDCALEATFRYCGYVFGRQSQGESVCRSGAARTYEHVISGEQTDFKSICRPFLLDQCDSGRKVFLAKLEKNCQ